MRAEFVIIEPEYIEFLSKVKNNIFVNNVLPNIESERRYLDLGISIGHFDYLVPIEENSNLEKDLCDDALFKLGNGEKDNHLRFDKMIPCSDLFFSSFDYGKEEGNYAAKVNDEIDFIFQNYSIIEKKIKKILVFSSKKEEFLKKQIPNLQKDLISSLADYKYMANMCVNYSKSEFFKQARYIRKGYIDIATLEDKHFFISKNKRFTFIDGILDEKKEINGYVRNLDTHDLYFEKNLAQAFNFTLKLDTKVTVPGAEDDEAVKDVMRKIKRQKIYESIKEEEKDGTEISKSFFKFRYEDENINNIISMPFSYVQENYTVLFGKLGKTNNFLNVIIQRERDKCIFLVMNFANGKNYKLDLSRCFGKEEDSFKKAKRMLNYLLNSRGNFIARTK